jgi:hypothetical protein
METEPEDYNKPTYDGRKEFLKHLREAHLDKIALSRQQGDLLGLYRAIKGYFIVVCPYIRDEDIKSIEAKLKKAENALQASSIVRGRNINMALTQLELQLDEIHKDISIAAKDVMLPTGAEEETEFDKDSFLAGGE